MLQSFNKWTYFIISARKILGEQISACPFDSLVVLDQYHFQVSESFHILLTSSTSEAANIYDENEFLAERIFPLHFFFFFFFFLFIFLINWN